MDISTTINPFAQPPRPGPAVRPAAPAAAHPAQVEIPDVVQTTERVELAPSLANQTREAVALDLGGQGIRLRIDKTTQRVVAQILDANDEVIRQIPPEELLRLAARFQELQGILFDAHA